MVHPILLRKQVLHRILTRESERSGLPGLGSLLTMPTSGKLEVDYHKYGSEYSGEQAVPGWYSNTLTRYGILTEVTSTMRTSIERYHLQGWRANILLNLGEGLTNESGATVRKINDTEIEGSKLLGILRYNRRRCSRYIS